jgi:chlorophyll/bacteriochlorophyll a synthase
MDHSIAKSVPATTPSLRASLELLKPVTWFAPMWAYGCGIVSSGVSVSDHPWTLIAGVALCGPLVCGTSQACNDWYDRHVDAINEPHRPIPSGRIPGRWGLYIALGWTCLSLLVAYCLGLWVFYGTILGLIAAWAYSAPPARLKMNGWWGNAAVGLCYEGLPWFTAAAAMLATRPPTEVIVLALLYSIGAHGIMTLNDFKAVEGDRQMGIGSLPVQLGEAAAAKLACAVMAIPQIIVAGLLVTWDRPLYAAIIAASLISQIGFMTRLLKDPKKYAPWYNGTGVTLYVLGMLASAIAIRGGIL